MKIKLPLFFIFIFLIFGKLKAQQCLTGGCTITGSEYPSSGAPYSSTSSWQVLINPASGNPAQMNGGNWTRFNVTAGNTYEWTYCESIASGAVSTAWDAQLTLSNNSNPSSPICFSTDVCGTNGNAPYISWVATFTGTVRLLSTAYVSGIGGCQTNSCSCYNRLAYRQVSSGYNLTITVHNVGGATMNGAKVILYNSSWSPLQTLFTNASGQVIFSGLSSASYNYETYYTPSGTNPPITPSQEFWGSGSTTISGSNLSISFTRIQPYISSPTPFSPSTVNTGQQTTGGYTVTNPLPYSTNSYVSIWVDRDQVSGWDYTNQAPAQAISSGGTFPFSFNVTPTNSGSYSKYAFVYSLVNGNYVITDQYAWSSAFTANSSCTTPAIPATATGTATSQTSANLSWTAGNPVGSPNITYYWVVGTSSTVTYGNGVDFGTTTGTTVSTTALTCGTPYYLRVYAQTSCNGTSSGYITSTQFSTSACSGVPVYGIDVSHWQGVINWSQVHSIGNKTFTFVKATEGASGYAYTSYFTTNIVDAESAGLITGAYHLARPDNGNSAVSEANYFLSVAGSYIGSGHLPPAALDLEGSIADLVNISTLTTWIQQWMTTVQNATGVAPILYLDQTYVAKPSFSVLNGYKIWVADPDHNPASPPSTGVWTNWDFKQYYGDPSPGSCPGISVPVDLDVFNGDITALNNLINISSSLPDLTISTGTQSVLPATVAAGSSVTASASEYNNGNATASTGTSVGLWLSSSSTLNTSSSTYLGAISGYPSLPQGTNSAPHSATVNIPCNTLPGVYYLFFWADGGSCTSGSNCTTCNGLVSESNGCNNFASVPITITANNLSATVTPSGSVNFCGGSSIALNANTGVGITYQWYKSGVAQAGATSATFTTGNPGTYYVVETISGCGTLTSNSVVVIQINNANPVVTYTTPTTFCAPGTITFTANTFSGVTYQWQKNSIDILGATSQTYTATTNGKYRVKETASGCTKQGQDVQVNAATSVTAVIIANGPTTFCTGGSVLLSETNNIPGYSYQWKNNGVNISGATTSNYTATTSGTYSCYVSASCGNATSNTITVSTGGIAALVNPSGTVNICSGATVSLSANTGTGFAYQWKLNGTNISGATSANYNATSAGSYTVSITSPCGNATSPATTVAIAALTATASPASTTICNGSAATFTANTGYNFTYQWYRAGIAIAGATSSTHANSTAGNYTVKITQGGVCSTTSNIAALTVISNPNPTVTLSGPTTFCVGQSVTITANTFAGVTYQWIKGSTNIAGATNQAYTATTSGQYNVKETASGCTKQMGVPIVVTVNCREKSSVSIGDESDNIKIYPNPNSGKFTIELPTPTDKLMEINVVNVLGQIVYSISIENVPIAEINLENESKGIYTVQLKVGREIYNRKLIIQ